MVIFNSYVKLPEGTQNMALHGTVPPFWDPGIPIETSRKQIMIISISILSYEALV